MAALGLGILRCLGNVAYYHPELNKVTGCPVASILLERVIAHSGRGKFYKYMCPVEGVTKGDTWTEELGLTRYQVASAFNRIGTRLREGAVVSSFQEIIPTNIVLHYRDRSNKTWYKYQEHILLALLNQDFVIDVLDDTAEGPAALADVPPLESEKPPVIVSGGLRAEEVFALWQEMFVHPRAKLDESLKRAVDKRIAEGRTLEDFRQAFQGNLNSDHHQCRNGQGNRNSKGQPIIYDGLDLICRNAAKFDWFMNNGQGAAEVAVSYKTAAYHEI